MKVTILFFGIATDLVKTTVSEIEIEKNATVLCLKKTLQTKYLELKNLSEYAIAVNETYAENDTILSNGDVVAVIPPVSGG